MRVILSLILMFDVLGGSAVQDLKRYRPNPRLTPGEALKVSKQDLCGGDYSSPAQKIPMPLKIQVFERYGIGATAVAYNVDHLIPVDLGGSNSIKNLWPQPLSGEWTYQMKNRLETRLRKMVCSGEIELENAQREIASDWVGAYEKYIAKTRHGPRD